MRSLKYKKQFKKLEKDFDWLKTNKPSQIISSYVKAQLNFEVVSFFSNVIYKTMGVVFHYWLIET